MTRTDSRLTAAAITAAVGVSAEARQIETADLYGLPSADVVILGEVHDNPIHHAHQALAVEALGTKALVFEMLTERQALRATPSHRSEAMLSRILEWEASGWPEFSLYYPIFVAAGEAPVFGGALERAEVRRAVSDGAAAVLGASAPLFGLDMALPAAEQTA